MSVEGVRGLEWSSGHSRVALDVIPLEVLGALSRLRTRFMQCIDALPRDSAETPTRCNEWRVVDVVNHLADTTGWASDAISAAAEGRHSDLFGAGFDVRATPKALTDAVARDLDSARARLHAAMAANLGQVGEVVALRDRMTDTPLGPQPFPVAALHVLWDTWLHERDLLLPLGVEVPEHEDEVRLCAVYTLRMIGLAQVWRGRSLSVALRLHGATEQTVRLDATPQATEVRIVDAVAADTPVFRGDAATAVDALTGRGDLDAALQGPQEERRALSVLGRFLAGV
jgi:uncharacterized protein (TIGR03083 family)